MNTRPYLLSFGFIVLLLASCGPGGPNTGSVTDIDGNTYCTVDIHGQRWTCENLKVKRYRNGDDIPNVTDNGQWATLTTGAWRYYNDDPSTEETYGILYNWYALMDPRGLAPAGYHIPSYEEWSDLEYNLGQGPEAGGKLKVTGTSYWLAPNTGATNESGFKALPGGVMQYDGFSYGLNTAAVFGTSSESGSLVYAVNLTYNSKAFYHVSRYKEDGVSVRCIQD